MAAKSMPLFESTTCSRCGGSGRYSYNMMDGDRCYGCSGRGYVLTKRGKAAQSFLDNMRSCPVEDLKVGDLVLVDLFFSKAQFLKLEGIRPDEYNPGRNMMILDFPGVAWGTVFGAGIKMRVGFTAQEKAAQVKLALEYQSKLTKSGTIMKSKSK